MFFSLALFLFNTTQQAKSNEYFFTIFHSVSSSSSIHSFCPSFAPHFVCRMDSDGREFLLTSPSYRIEKARLRYENLLLSLEDDSVDDAERYINTTDDTRTEDTLLDITFDANYDSCHTSQLESKQSHDHSQPQSNHPMRSPITGPHTRTD